MFKLAVHPKNSCSNSRSIQKLMVQTCCPNLEVQNSQLDCRFKTRHAPPLQQRRYSSIDDENNSVNQMDKEGRPLRTKKQQSKTLRNMIPRSTEITMSWSFPHYYVRYTASFSPRPQSTRCCAAPPICGVVVQITVHTVCSHRLCACETSSRRS